MTTGTINIEKIGVKREDLEAIKVWLTDTRKTECSTALKRWIQVGEICTKIKESKLKGLGKFSVQCQMVFGMDLIDDERQYSMKLYAEQKDIVKWYNETGCMKYNPRTIYTAYKNKDKKPKTKEEKEAEKAEKAETELRKERHGSDAIAALVAYRRVRNKAGEDGNLLLGDLETLRQELENELAEIMQAIELEAPVQESKPTKKGKGKGKVEKEKKAA